MSRLIVIPKDDQTSIYSTIDTSSFLNEELSWKEKGILAYLLSRPPGWKVNVQDLCNRSRDGKCTVYKLINSLRDKKYIHRTAKYKNGKIKEWIFIVFPRPTDLNKQKIHDLLPTDLDLGFKEVLIYINNINTSDPILPKKHPKTKKAKNRTKNFMIYAKKLSEIIQSSKNIKISSQRLRSWSDDIRKLHETDGIDKDRIKQAIIWYRHNIGGQYIPVIESGASFRSKFLKLEAAMERAGELNKYTNNDVSESKKNKIRVGH